MNWTGGRLRRHSEINAKARKQQFGKTRRAVKGSGLDQITLFRGKQLGQSLEKDSERRRGEKSVGAVGDQNRTNLPVPPSTNTNTNTQAAKPLDRLERMKRQLLETNDWAAVGAARPVQVAFTPEEELERFGKRRRLTKDDHARLNTDSAAMPPRPRARDGESWDGDVPEGLEIRMDGRRLGQDQNTVNEDSQSQHNAVSSQSMLLGEDSFGSASNQRFSAGDPSQNRTGARSISGLSMLSTGPQVDHFSQHPFTHGFQGHNQDHNQGHPGPQESDSMEWASDERMEPHQSNESSSLIPHPDSPVRRRFTIDEQAIVERGRFLASSPAEEQSTRQLLYHGQVVRDSPNGHMRSSFEPSSQMRSRLGVHGQPNHVNGPLTNQLLHERAYDNRMISSLGASSQMGSMLDNHHQWNDMTVVQVPPAPRPAFSQLAWSSQAQHNAGLPGFNELVGYSMTQGSNHTNSSWSREESVSPRSMPGPGTNQFAEASMEQAQNLTNMSWDVADEERASPMRVYGQAVAFEDSGLDANGRARRLTELLDLGPDANHNPSYLSGATPYRSPRRVTSNRFN